MCSWRNMYDILRMRNPSRIFKTRRFSKFLIKEHFIISIFKFNFGTLMQLLILHRDNRERARKSKTELEKSLYM